METQNAILLVLIPTALVSLIVLGWWVGVFNGLIRARNKVKEALGVVDSQVEQFNALLGLLEQMTREGTAEEKSIHQMVLTARADLTRRRSTTAAAGDDGADRGASASAEDPMAARTMQASAAVRYLMESAPVWQGAAVYAKAEDKVADALKDIAAAWRMLRGAVEAQRDACQVFPACFVATAHGFRPLPSPDTYADIRPQRISWNSPR